MLTMTTEYDEPSEDKNDSEMCDIALSEQAENMIVELNAMHGEAKDKVFDLIETLKKDGLKDHQIKSVIFSRVKFISKRRLYEIIPEEYKREYTKPLPKTINISSEHKVIDVEPRQSAEDSIPVIPEPTEHLDRELERLKKEAHKRDPITPVDFKEEDPKDLEIRFLRERVGELEDALKKTQQFRPASALEQLPKVIESAEKEDERVHSWLKSSADGIGAFYYDTYGIDLFKNRELSQLKNSGVKVFKRLYFEV